MRDDNTARIVLAAKRRSELTRAKAVQAIRQFERTGAPVTFESIAHSAGVSRSWLYGQTDLRLEIERLRDSSRKSPLPIPTRQRTSDASLLARLQTALEQCRKLAEENKHLRRQLACALGERRAFAPRDREPTLLFDDNSRLADTD